MGIKEVLETSINKIWISISVGMSWFLAYLWISEDFWLIYSWLMVIDVLLATTKLSILWRWKEINFSTLLSKMLVKGSKILLVFSIWFMWVLLNNTSWLWFTIWWIWILVSVILSLLCVNEFESILWHTENILTFQIKENRYDSILNLVKIMQWFIRFVSIELLKFIKDKLENLKSIIKWEWEE